MVVSSKQLQIKKTEILQIGLDAARRFGSSHQAAAQSAVEAFARLTAPTQPEPVVKMITLGSFGDEGGSSRKPGNIFLNWRKLMDVVPDTAIAAAGAMTSPVWLLPLIGLYVWNRLWRGAEEELSDVEACTICALWKNRDGRSRISEEEGFNKTNAMRTLHGLPELSRAEYTKAVNRLLAMECIEINSGIIWLREWVRVSY